MFDNKWMHHLLLISTLIYDSPRMKGRAGSQNSMSPMMWPLKYLWHRGSCLGGFNCHGEVLFQEEPGSLVTHKCAFD